LWFWFGFNAFCIRSKWLQYKHSGQQPAAAAGMVGFLDKTLDTTTMSEAGIGL
jgi:hypothetical protein